MSKKKLYCVLDCETATLPFVNEITKTAKQKQEISIAKPLIYDLGYRIIDRNNNVYTEKSFLITEIFSVPQVFNTAYYKEKRPLYIEKLKNNDIALVTWEFAINELLKDIENCEAVGAFNAMFDFKKAIPFTEKYINALYSNSYQKWEEEQKRHCEYILSKPQNNNNKDFKSQIFEFRGEVYPLFDIWGLSCKRLLNNSSYKKECLKNRNITASGKFFKTSAETTYQYLLKDFDFIESHTAYEDALIESYILKKILSKGKIEMGIIYFPFRELGTTIDFISTHKVPKICLINLLEVLQERAKETLTTRSENEINRQIMYIKNLL